MDIKIGADPEFFVKVDDKHVSAYNLVEVTKANPQPVKNGAVQVDGMALEFNIDPVDTAQDFVSNIKSVLEQLRALVPQKYKFDFSPVAHFDPDYIKGQPEEARILGCEPDFSAYTGKENPTPDAAKNFRTASGHIHVGWTEDMDVKDPDHIDACRMLAKQLDMSLGMFSVIIDDDTTRRELYGLPGAYRVKSYGVEYRVMSNVWLREDWMMKEVFRLTKKSFTDLLAGKKYYPRVGAIVKKTIQSGDFKKAVNFLYNNNLTSSSIREAIRERQMEILAASNEDTDEFETSVAVYA